MLLAIFFVFYRYKNMKTLKDMLLKQGDLVALAATARKVTPDEVQPAIRLFESWGLRVSIPDGLFDTDNQFAGNDFHRAAILQELIDSNEVKAIFCVRGGYGTVRIVDDVDFGLLKTKPKWIVGYSDITVLHSHIECNCGVPTLHATMPLNIPPDACSRHYLATETLHQVLFDGHLHYDFENNNVDGIRNRCGRCCAPIVGGNLSVLYSLLGSSSDINTEDKILLIEDLDEYLYHIDRMMMALKRSGKLKGLRGLLVGAMNDMHDNAVPFGRTAEQIVRDAVADYDYPVAFHCPFGHIGTDNRALPLGVTVTIEVGENDVVIDM